MDSQEFYLCFDASYVLIYHLELKTFKYNYKKFGSAWLVFLRNEDLLKKKSAKQN